MAVLLALAAVLGVIALVLLKGPDHATAAGLLTDEPLPLFDAPSRAGEVPPTLPRVPESSAPEPRAAAGWPFPQLPEATKFSLPVPQVGLSFDVPSLYREALLHFLPGSHSTAVYPAELRPWFLLPVAVGVLALSETVRTEESDDPRDPPPEVVPEPGTLLLVASGLMLLGAFAFVRRP